MAGINYPESKEASAERLRQTRIAFMDGRTNKRAFTDQVGIEYNRWNNAEAGTQFIGHEDLMKLCRVTGVTTDWILRGDQQLLKPEFREKLAKVPPRAENAPKKALKRA